MFHNPASQDRFLKKPAKYEFETLDVFQILYYAELDECLKQYEAGVNLCKDTELQFILSAICDANSPKVTQGFIDGKHADIYNELKQMVYDKEAMDMLFSEELAHTDWVTMEKEIKNLKSDNSDMEQQLANKDQQIANKDKQIANKDQQIANKDQQIAEKDSQISDLMNNNSDMEQQIAALKKELEKAKSSLNP